MNRNLVIVAVITVIVTAGAVYTLSVSQPPTSNSQLDNATPSLSSLNTGDIPWAAEKSNLPERLKAANLPALATEGNTLHTHQHLDVYVNGQTVPVPEDIGIDEQKGYISPLHTHDGTGIVHVESPTVQNFTLGQFFNVWGVRLTNDCLGGYCNDESNKLQLYLNGQPYSGNFADLSLQPYQEITIIYGNNSQQPASIPFSYNFPQGY